jgi:hypothetical protein
MRYVVDDDFSIALGEHLYQALLGFGQPLPGALQLALSRALGDDPHPGVPPLSAGTPALFGQRCVDLSLAPPARTGQQSFNVDGLKMAGFPAPADNLVGRSAVMGRAARVLGGLAADGLAGVLLTGPGGIGKTACAVELAYRHEHLFDRLVWYQGPRPGTDISEALTDLTLALERNLPEFRMREALADASTLAAFLPKLTELMETRSALVVLDGVDVLLTSGGGWRDDRWARVVTALASHHGLSRVLLTARQVPPSLPDGVAAESVGPLSAEESVLLARRLPYLGALLRGTSGQPAQQARRLAASALTQAAGNPAALRAIDHARVSEGDPAAAYLDLVTRWTPEL